MLPVADSMDLLSFEALVLSFAMEPAVEQYTHDDDDDDALIYS
jgi:hypothetical protein